jgi:microcystin degradation protein MlrC
VKLVLAQMKHETNTFSPVPTPLARFGRGRERPWEGREAYEEFKGTGSALGAFIDLAERAGAEVVLPVAAQASPSGRVAGSSTRWRWAATRCSSTCTARW